MRSREQFHELCLRWLEEERKALPAGETDPEPTLLLDTADARELGGVEIVRLGDLQGRYNRDFIFYVYVPASILRERAERWALVWAQWLAPMESAPETEREGSEQYARDMYLLEEEVIDPPSMRPDRIDVVSLWSGDAEGERWWTYKIKPNEDGAPTWTLFDEGTGVQSGRMTEPAREAVRLLADEAGEPPPETMEEFEALFARYTARVKENVADARRVME